MIAGDDKHRNTPAREIHQGLDEVIQDSPRDVSLVEDPTPSPEPGAEDIVEITQAPTATSLAIEPGDSLEKKLVILAQEDLVDRLGNDVESIHLVRIEAITWPYASLGCPQPNMFYAQVLTPGYRIVLEAGGEVSNYHTNMDAKVIFCDISNPTFLKETPSTRD